MNADLNQRLDYELLTLEHQKKEYSLQLKEFSDCKNAFLRRSKRGGENYYYYIKRNGSSSYRYIGRASSPDVNRICRERFLTEAIRRIDSNIERIQSFQHGYLPFDSSHINDSLPFTYRCEVSPISEMYKTISDEWLAKNLEFQQRFLENYPEKKKHRTSDGVMVKTISEVLIYEKFKDAGLTTIYELPFQPIDHGPVLYPDFATLSPVDMESVIFVEYVGLMDLQQYRENFARKVGRYIDSGYIPGVNLFFIFSDRKGNIDSLQITKVISDIFGLRDPHIS